MRTNALGPVAATLVLVALIVALVGEPAAHALRYERGAVRAGEFWRLLSGHAVHLGWLHLALNALALGLVATFLGREYGALAWWGLALLSALGVGLGLLTASPKVDWYVGLSGLIHGLVAAGAVARGRRHRGAGAAVLAVLASKLAWEQFQGALPGAGPLLGGATVVDAHLWGSLAGLLGATLVPWAARRRRDPPVAR